MVFIVIIVAVLFIAAYAVVWHFLFGMPNGQLATAKANIVAPAADGAAAASSSSAAADSTSTDIANPTLPEEKLSIDRGTWTVEMATTMVEQARGLSYRTSLASDTGMLFVFSSPGVQNFWMKDMHFPLDMIWIGADGTVAGYAQDVPAPAPGTALWNLPVYSSPGGVNEVLEVNAGTVAKYGIKVGDKVTVAPL